MAEQRVVLITGSEGFLGREVCKQFRADSNYVVITTDRELGADFVGDLASPDFVQRLPNCDVLVNCAAVQYVTKNKPLFLKKRFFHKNNVYSMELLLERYGNGIAPHVIHVGTSMVYKMTGQLHYTETAKLAGQGVYSESKLVAQSRLGASHVNQAVVVPCIIGGKGRGGLFNGLIRSISLFGLAVIPGPGIKKTSIVHKYDVASLIKTIADYNKTGVYNAAAEDALSFNDWARLVAGRLSKKVKILNLPLLPIRIISQISNYNLLASEQLYMLRYPHVLDITKSKAIGWAPKYTVSEIIDEIVQDA